MKSRVFAGVSLVLLATPGLAEQRQVVTGPVAEYWVSAATTTGVSGALEGGGRPSLGSMMGMVMRGGPNFNGVNHHLTLQLGSRQGSDAPQADHLPPAALGVGADLPLVTPAKLQTAPAPAPAEERPTVEKYRQQKPRGRMLFFWGCGEHAGPGQPYVIDFAKMSADPQGFARIGSAFRGFATSPETPPAPSRNTTYGDWPNARSGVQIPANGSLAGDHLVRSTYGPEIRFTLRPENDFMGPMQLATNATTPTGSVQLAWAPVAGARAYLATVIGGGGRGDGGGGDGGDAIVMWTSSQTQAPAFAAPQYLSNGDIARLVAGGPLMAQDTGSCAVPQEVAAALPHGLLSMTAYGGELNLTDPPRPTNPRTPWNISWSVKVRYRSAMTGFLGQPMPGRGSQAPAAPQDPMKSVLRGLGGFIPHP